MRRKARVRSTVGYPSFENGRLMLATILHVALTFVLADEMYGPDPQLGFFALVLPVIGWAVFEAHRVYEGQQDIICDLVDEIRVLKNSQD